MNIKKTYLVFDSESSARCLFIFKPLKIENGKIYSCRLRFGISNGKMKLLMKTFLCTTWDKDMNKGYEHFACAIENDLIISDEVKTHLVENGLTVEQVENLQMLLAPESFSYTENDKFIDEDDFYELQEKNIGRWIDTFKEPGTFYEDFFAHLQR